MKPAHASPIHHLHVIFLALALVLSVASAAPAAEGMNEIYVVNSNPPSVAIVNSEAWQLTGSIPLSTTDAIPTRALIGSGPGNRYLYVIQNGTGGRVPPKNPSELSVLDLSTRRFVKEVPLGWRVWHLALSKDERYLITVGFGKAYRGKSPEGGELGSVTVIDTQNMEVAFRSSGWRPGSSFNWTGDVSRIFVLGARQLREGEHLGIRGEIKGGQNATSPSEDAQPLLTVFKDRSDIPLAQIAVGPASGMALSADEKWLYLPYLGIASPKDVKKQRNGTVQVVDVESMKVVASHDLGNGLKTLSWNRAKEEVRLVGTFGKDNERKAYRLVGSQLLPAVEPDTEETAASTWGLGGTVIAQTPVPPHKVAVLNSNHRLGIVNLDEKRLENTAEIGRGSVRTAKSVGREAVRDALFAGGIVFMGSAVGAASIVGYAAASTWISPGATFKALQARPDGKFLYALDNTTNDVTIVNSENGSVLDYVPVGSDCSGLLLSPDGKFIWALARTRLTLIDTASNKQLFQHEFGGEAGELRDWKLLPGNGRLLLLFDHELQCWGPNQASPVATIKGLAEARLIVLPPATN